MLKISFIFIFTSLLLAQKPNLLLLKIYKDQNITGWVMSEKLDGVRAYWDGTQLLSRGGKIIYAPEWFLEGYPPFEIDGELWSKRGDFDHISSIVRDRVPSKEWRLITHNIFEVPNADGNLSTRLKQVGAFENASIKIVKQIKVDNKDALQKFLKYVESLGGEGVVVRDPKVAYINKRTSSALKVKTFHDAECRVTGYTEGKGKYSGKMGALQCELPNGVIFKIGSGFSDAERAKPPKIGSQVTFKYKEFTKNAKPRFPIYLRAYN